MQAVSSCKGRLLLLLMIIKNKRALATNPGYAMISLQNGYHMEIPGRAPGHPVRQTAGGRCGALAARNIAACPQPQESFPMTRTRKLILFATACNFHELLSYCCYSYFYSHHPNGRTEKCAADSARIVQATSFPGAPQS